MAGNGRLVIGICGGSGSGKTSFIHALRNAFAPDDICFISQDDYYYPRDQQAKDSRGIRNFDRPESINAEALADELGKVIAGNEVKRMEYTFNNPLVKPRQLVYKPAPIILVEGLFVFHFREVACLLTMKLFIQAREDLKVIRRIKRDGLERNYPLDDVLYRYENHVAPTYQRFIKPYLDEADMVINNNNHYEVGLSVLMGFLKHYLTHKVPVL